MSQPKSTSPSTTAAHKAPAAATPAGIWQPTNQQLWLLTLCLAVLYFILGRFSKGFYQHDEAAHYLDMRTFWHEPARILSNWSKPGYKLLYALPALLGPGFVMFTNAAIAAICGLLVVKTAQRIGIQGSFWGWLLLACQPLWIMLAFRNYSELPSALVLIAAVYFYYDRKLILSALVLSYLAFIRQEAYPILALYGLFLLIDRKWLAAVCVGFFPLVHNVWGWAVTGDPLYLPHEILGFSSGIKDAFPRQGGDHYFLMSLTIFGAVALTSFFAWLALAIRKEVPFRKMLPVFVPLVVYFLLHVLFNVQSFKFGPSTGGNLRYLIVISPLLALLGTQALDRLPAVKDRKVLIYILSAFLLVTIIWLSHDHNLIKFQPGRDLSPAVMVGLVAVTLLLPIPSRALFFCLGLMSVFFLFKTVRMPKYTQEELALQRAVKWAKQRNLDQEPLFANHSIFFYFYGKPPLDFANCRTNLNEIDLLAATKGTYIFWDSHYSFRPQEKRGLNYNWFTDRPQDYKFVEEFLTNDKTFGALVFQKTSNPIKVQLPQTQPESPPQPGTIK